MKFTRENCLGDDYGKAFAMALLDKSCLGIDEEDTVVDLFTGTINKRVKFFHNETYSDVTWTEEGNYVTMECKKGTRFYHPTWISNVRCLCCMEKAIWHGMEPNPTDLPVAELCLDKQD